MAKLFNVDTYENCYISVGLSREMEEAIEKAKQIVGKRMRKYRWQHPKHKRK